MSRRKRLSDDDLREALSPIEEVVEEALNGRMYILVDAEDRENEGDLVIPAQFATPAQVNFMAKHGRGLICLAMTESRTRALGLQPMARDNQTRHKTAFMVSIEAREGISTGISAHDRAHTIAVAIDPTKGAEDIVSPGHVFPLTAREGGVLVRAGHTEASVDIARLAGLIPAAVICEIMNDDGTMARLPDLVKFAQTHGLKIGTIADLIAYRRINDRLVEKVSETEIETPFGAFRGVAFRNSIDGQEHLALVRDGGEGPTLVRMHRVSFGGDVLPLAGARTGLIERALATIGREGGVMVLLNPMSGAHTVSDALASPEPAPKEAEDRALREYGVGAHILRELGVSRMVLLTSTQPRIVGLEGFGLELVGWRALDGAKEEA